MLTWPGLFHEIDRLDVAGRRARAVQAEFEQWAALAERRTMADARLAAVARADEVRDQTGLETAVTGPAGPEGVSRLGTTWSAVSLSLGTCRVDLYSVRRPAESPMVHFGVTRGPTLTRHPVLATLPGALVVRRAGNGLEYVALPLSRDHERSTTTLDALVLRAFELLVGAHCSTLRFASEADRASP